MEGILSTKIVKCIVQFVARIEMFAHIRHDWEPSCFVWVVHIRCAFVILLEQWVREER